jgi:hypothetical protein
MRIGDDHPDALEATPDKAARQCTSASDKATETPKTRR